MAKRTLMDGGNKRKGQPRNKWLEEVRKDLKGGCSQRRKRQKIKEDGKGG